MVSPTEPAGLSALIEKASTGSCLWGVIREMNALKRNSSSEAKSMLGSDHFLSAFRTCLHFFRRSCTTQFRVRFLRHITAKNKSRVRGNFVKNIIVTEKKNKSLVHTQVRHTFTRPKRVDFFRAQQTQHSKRIIS